MRTWTASAAFLILLLGCAAFPAFAAIQIADEGFYLDLPEGYHEISEGTGGRYQLVDATETALLEIFAYDGKRYAKADAILDDAKKKLAAQVKGTGFRFQGRDASIGQIAFSQSGLKCRGFFFCMNGKEGERDYLLLSYADAEAYSGYENFLVSALDSFSPDASGLRLPGPVSSSAFPVDAKKDGSAALNYGGASLAFPVAKGEAAALQEFIEREARVLSAYADEALLRDSAWKRYYRMIYRDSYHRLDALAFVVGVEIEKRAASGSEARAASGSGARPADREYVEAVIAWVQEFAFTRLKTDSDLMNPIDCALKGDGDCDARALLMAILLHHWNIDAGMAVSYAYSHALALVDLPGSQGFNAGIVADGKRYLVAETTAKVKPGLIEESQADPEKWIGIGFNF
jgi:hypothetical protein